MSLKSWYPIGSRWDLDWDSCLHSSHIDRFMNEIREILDDSVPAWMKNCDKF